MIWDLHDLGYVALANISLLVDATTDYRVIGWSPQCNYAPEPGYLRHRHAPSRAGRVAHT